jgi:hypothetical protein
MAVGAEELDQAFAAQRSEGGHHCTKAKSAAAATRSSEIRTAALVVYW